MRPAPRVLIFLVSLAAGGCATFSQSDQSVSLSPETRIGGPPLAGCGRGLEQDFDWHWRHNRDANHSVLIERLFAVGLPGTPDEGRNGVFTSMTAEQAHSPVVENGYRACHMASPVAFWEGVAGAAWGMNEGMGYSWEGIRENLNWQWRNKKSSILDAQRANTDPTNPYRRVLGMHYAMWGQRHNPGVTFAYRAAFRDDPDRFFQLVNAYR